ncbi:cbb3-type cytochrome c oxidase subunit I [Diaphorobacter ruginosibacter]|uniref:Cbb3-type cytochrome c oxidase subunit I n=1 Tax=Diaphorobacter ruginosibacter TaxID=1715720 RepID=A0A7G9RJ59_9BURK|nr:cbb3-type cytochrome c oxidase subunit I [Diaphorobacter ruginosibacter]QNN55634.1 cbb3-type cytochrome c oxidase subunit I [Diaphorobacter ruginosibacter]
MAEFTALIPPTDSPSPAAAGPYPNDLPRPPGEREALERAWKPPRGWRRLSAVNNSQIGLYYIAAAMLFFVLGGVLALIMRVQLATPNSGFVVADTYNQLFTMHGTVMMFLFAVPVVEAVAVFLLPNMLGARDLPFPRLSAYAFWAYAIGGLAFFLTLFWSASPDGGWFMYPPLTGTRFSPGIGADFWLLGIGFIEISAIAGAIELIIGILFTRAPGMTLLRMPVFAWAVLVSAVMIIFAFPAVIAATTLLELERAFDWPFFDPLRGGDPLVWQHLFWFFGHPEVYIIFLPAAGMVSMMVPAMAATPLVGQRAVVVALIGVGAVSFLLWIHHMFTSGVGIVALVMTSVASFVVAIPSGLQVFAWIATFWSGRVRLNTPTLFLLGFHFIFVLGGLTGVMVAVLPFDWQMHDSYFIVAHLHYVLIGGMVFPLFAALYYWFPVLKGTRLSERVGRWAFAMTFCGFNLAFFPMHVSGMLGMPRRVHTYADGLGWNLMNLLSTVGAFVLAAGIALILLDVLRATRKPAGGEGNPWKAGSLEWLPQRSYGVRSIPQVHGTEPLWDDPQLAQQVEQGRWWLPGTVFGGRETLITDMRTARPIQVLRLPSDGWPPLLAALGTAGFFLLLTVQWIFAALLSGLGAIAAIILWTWQLDRAAPSPTAHIGGGVLLPTRPKGRRSHSWWACAILIIVDCTVLASFIYAYVHLSMALEICPPPGSALPSGEWGLAGALLMLAGSVLMLWNTRAKMHLRPEDQSALRGRTALALLCTIGAFGMALSAQLEAGLSPRADGWNASVAMLLAYQGFHLLILSVLGCYLLARSRSGHLRPDARATLDNIALIWHAATLQALVTELVLRLVPFLMT